MLFRFCLYGFLKNQRYFEPFLMLVFLQQGLSYFAIGSLLACRIVTVNVLEIPSGALADSWGRRGCMVLSFVAYIASFLLFAFAGNPVWFFPAMMLYGVGESFRTGTHKAMIFEWLRLEGREDERTKFYGLTRSWSKYGSAVSSVLAAIFVFWTGDYRSIFLFATIPYAINIVNFLGYPPELDGDHEKDPTLGGSLRLMLETIATAWNQLAIRRLTMESMCWDGLYHAIKDYLQPVLALLAVQMGSAYFGWSYDAANTVASEVTPETRMTAVLIGLVYTILFLVSGAASRFSYRFADWAGGDSAASRRLWWLQLGVFVGLIVADGTGHLVLLAAVFVAINLLQNLWRPILIARYDQLTEPRQGATIMSIESQARRVATLVLAPAAGYLVDLVGREGGGGQFWPIGAIGILLCFVALTLIDRHGRE